MNLMPRRAVLLGVLALVLAAPQARAFLGGRGHFNRTVYTVPVETGLLMPTSYVTSTSFLTPTSYLVPTSSISFAPTVYATSYRPAVFATSYRPTVFATSYAVRPTSYLVSPTSYVTSSSYLVPTSVVVPTTRVIPSSYLAPTQYLAPTTYLYDLPLIRTSATICDEEVVTIAPPSSSYSLDFPSAPPSNGDPPLSLDETQGAREAELSPNQGRVIESQPEPQQAPAQPQQAPAQPEQAPALEQPRMELPEPPGPQLPAFGDPDPSPPAVPSDLPQPDDLGQRRNFQDRLAMRPAAPEPLSPVASSPVLIEGLVRRGDAADPSPVANARISFVDRRGRFEDRFDVSDGDGRFSVDFLPDGDWLIEVRDAGEDDAQSYGNITVSGGRVTDAQGRDRSYLVLNR